MLKKSIAVLFCIVLIAIALPTVLAEDEKPADQENVAIEKLPFESDAGFQLRSLFKIKPSEISGKLGSKTNPIRCCKPTGERAYLSRLLDADGKPVTFTRKGSVGTGVYGHILDLYIIVDSKGKSHEVYIDMYYTKLVDDKPIENFTFKEEETE